MNTNKCGTCDGSGYLRHFAHVDGGICYTCDGTGEIEISDPPPPVVETWTPGASLDLRIDGEIFRCYSFADRAWEVIVIRPEYDTGADPDSYHVGALWFRDGGTVEASDGMRYGDVRGLAREDKRRLFAAAREVSRACATLCP